MKLTAIGNKMNFQKFKIDYLLQKGFGVFIESYNANDVKYGFIYNISALNFNIEPITINNSIRVVSLIGHDLTLFMNNDIACYILEEKSKWVSLKSEEQFEATFSGDYHFFWDLLIRDEKFNDLFMKRLDENFEYLITENVNRRYQFDLSNNFLNIEPTV